MTHEIEVLLFWTQVCLVVTAVCTTAFPLMYAFSPWYKSPIGRALMTQGIAFALAIDLTAVFQFWFQDMDMFTALVINAFVFTLITAATGWLAFLMARANYRKLKNPKERDNAADFRTRRGVVRGKAR